MIGTVAMLVALALVPSTWHCSGAITGWNFVIFALLAGGGTAVGAAAGHVARRRLVGVAVTALVVVAALTAIAALAAQRCDWSIQLFELGFELA
jgi:hypothetical protein